MYWDYDNLADFLKTMTLWQELDDQNIFIVMFVSLVVVHGDERKSDWDKACPLQFYFSWKDHAYQRRAFPQNSTAVAVVGSYFMFLTVCGHLQERGDIKNPLVCTKVGFQTHTACTMMSTKKNEKYSNSD